MFAQAGGCARRARVFAFMYHTLKSCNVYACMHRPGQSKDRLWAGWRGIRLLCSATDALRASWATDSDFAAGQIGRSRAGLPDAAPRQRLSRTLMLLCRTLTGVEELDAALQCQADGRARKTFTWGSLTDAATETKPALGAVPGGRMRVKGAPASLSWSSHGSLAGERSATATKPAPGNSNEAGAGRLQRRGALCGLNRRR